MGTKAMSLDGTSAQSNSAALWGRSDHLEPLPAREMLLPEDASWTPDRLIGCLLLGDWLATLECGEVQIQ